MPGHALFASGNVRQIGKLIAKMTGWISATHSVPRLNRSSRMSASSLLLTWLAWLAFICTSLADADVVAGIFSERFVCVYARYLECVLRLHGRY